MRQIRGSNAEHVHHLDDNIQARAGRRGDQAGQGGHDAKDDQVAPQSSSEQSYVDVISKPIKYPLNNPDTQLEHCNARWLGAPVSPRLHG